MNAIIWNNRGQKIKPTFLLLVNHLFSTHYVLQLMISLYLACQSRKNIVHQEIILMFYIVPKCLLGMR